MNGISIIAGMPRAATTYLYHTLEAHPQFSVPSRKELEYFSVNYSRGDSWYRGFFRNTGSAEFSFDISPMYFFHDHSIQRIASYFQDPKVILVVRDPAEFSVSFFKNRLASSGIKPDFPSFLSGFDYHKDRGVIRVELGPGVFKRRIRKFMEAFADNLLLIDYRAVENGPLRALRAIETFLGVRPYFVPGSFSESRINSSDQLRHPIVNRLMHVRWFSDLVTTVFPKRLIMMVRLRVQTDKRRTGSILGRDEQARFLEMGRKHFTEDIDFVGDLFSRSMLVKGSGRELNTSSAPAGPRNI